MPEIDCLSSTSKAKLQIDDIEFSEIPGQSKLFLDYLNDPLQLKKYYRPRSPKYQTSRDEFPSFSKTIGRTGISLPTSFSNRIEHSVRERRRSNTSSYFGREIRSRS